MTTYKKALGLLEQAATASEMGNGFQVATHLEALLKILAAEYVQAQQKKGADGRLGVDLAPALFTRDQAAAILKDLYLGPGKSPLGGVMEIERGLGNLEQ